MRKRRRQREETSIPTKANRILNGILVVLILVMVRIWQLAVVQHEEKIEASKKPQRRTVVERAERATIRDRFDVLLATNKVQYNAAISYGEIREIPRFSWTVNAEGRRIKYPKRKRYITELAQRLGKELGLDGERLEDIIHSKTSVFGNVPFVIKENISEREYFRLKMMEKDWPGVHAERVAKRCYPKGAVGGEVVGYMGAISGSEYDSIMKEMRTLREYFNQTEEGENPFLPEGYYSAEQVELRLKELEGKAYTINDYIGKAGVEAAFDEQLRGLRGKRLYLSDIRGNFLRELPGSQEPTPGNRLYLSISSELQEYAERLLAEYEQAGVSPRMKSLRDEGLLPEKQPWIRGGGIVVMDPNTAEVLALASYPRFDPNDFIRAPDPLLNAKKGERIARWLENEAYLASLWDLKQPLERERFEMTKGAFYEEACELTWKTYLDLILPSKSDVRQTIERFGTLQSAIFLQTKVKELLSIFQTSNPVITASKIFDNVYRGEEDIPIGVTVTLQERDFFQEKIRLHHHEIDKIKEELHRFFHSLALNYDKLLLVDLCRIVVDPETFSPKLQNLFGNQSLEEFREISARVVSVQEALKKYAKGLFHELDFKKWREENFKDYLAEKRKQEEKEKKKFGRPYLEYLDEIEGLLFKQFWEEHHYEFLALLLSSDIHKATYSYQEALLDWKKEILESEDKAFPWKVHYMRLRTLLSDIDSSLLIPYLKTLRSYEELNRPLLGRYPVIRQSQGQQLEKHLAAAFYPTYGYGYARSQAFRQAATVGSIFKLVPAYEALRQRYVADNDKHKDLNPFWMIDDKHRTDGRGGGWNVGFSIEGKPIPRYYHGGLLPRSEHAGVGKVDLVRALEASSNPYFAILAGDILEDPEDLCRAANLLGYGEKTGIDLPGEISGSLPIDVAYNRTGLYSLAIGQHSLVGTPLQTAVMLSAIANGGKILKPKIVERQKIINNLEKIPTEERWQVFLPDPIRHLLLTGLKQVVVGDKGTARGLRKQFSPELIHQIVGKTSTAEVIERFSLDGTSGRLKCKRVWFGAIAFNPTASQEFANPELVVVVYLRIGEFGREAAPLAVKLVQKWREIQAKHKKDL